VELVGGVRLPLVAAAIVLACDFAQWRMVTRLWA
jgi:hypothetical protein